MAKKKSITETGPQSWRDLQKENQSKYSQPSKINKFSDVSTGYDYVRPVDISKAAGYEYSPIHQATGGEDYWGNSMFDDPYIYGESGYNYEAMSDTRAENQPWYAQVGAGLAKGAVLAGTTFLDGTIGLVTGIATAASEGRWSGLWDNDFSKAMQSVNEEMEKVLPNYYTQEEQESPWYENIFTANFLGDKFLKNLGFSVGAIYSGKVWTAPLTLGGKLSQAIGLVAKTSKAPAMVNSTIGAGISAVNEGRIEALNNSKDWYEAQKAQLDEMYKGVFQGIQEELDNTKGTFVKGPDGSIYDPAYITYETKAAKAQSDYEEALAKLNEDRTKMGNVDLLMNLPILWGSNLIQFGKFYANGYKTSRKANNIVKRAGKYTTDRSKAGATWAATKSALSEGTEEISQGAASRISGNYYETDVQNFYKAKIDPDAEQETLSWIKSFAHGINETVNDGNAWEEFFIGGLTGALGIPSIKRRANGKYGLGIEGGAYNEIQNYNEERAREEEIANRMNERLQSKEYLNYYQGLIRHNKYQKQMDNAADRGDEFDYKNAEHAQMIGDIILFDNAGKLNDLKTLINESFDTSDENLDSIIRNTTSRQEDDTLVGPYAQYAKLEDGQIVSNFGSNEDKQSMIDKLTQSKDDMLQVVNDYVKLKDDIDIRTGERLTDEQLQELTWLKSQINDWEKRAISVTSDVKQGVRSIIGNLSAFKNANQRIRDLEKQSHTSLTDTYRRADENIKRLERAINNLEEITRGEDKAVARYLAANPKFTKGVIDEIQRLPEEYMGQEDKTEIISKINDIQKLGKASKTYKAKLEEYLENPQTQVKDKNKATEQVAKETTKKAGSAIAQRFNFDKPLGEIADTLEENMNDIESAGGFDAFVKTLPEDQAKKLKKARSLKKGIEGLKTLVSESDMSDTQKRIADQLIEEHGRNADSIKALGDSLSEALNEGKVGQAIANALDRKEREGVNDLAIQEAIEDIEAKMREFLDDNIAKAAAAADQAEKMSNAKTDKELSDKAVSQAEALEQAEKENEGPTSDDVPEEPEGPKEFKEPKEPRGLKEPREPKGLKEPSEPSKTPSTPAKSSDIIEQPQVSSKDVKKSNAETNKMATRQAGPIQNKGNAAAFSERPQLSQVYMHGYDMQTYYQYITEHPEAIPEGVDKEAYTKYIREVWTYLNEHGAFQYISEKLSIGDEIEFVIDEDLNKDKKAGTIVILMRTTDSEGRHHIIGSLPTAIDMDSRTKDYGKPSKKTLAEERPGIKALYDKIVQEYKEWQKLAVRREEVRRREKANDEAITIQEQQWKATSEKTVESHRKTVRKHADRMLGVLRDKSASIEDKINAFSLYHTQEVRLAIEGNQEDILTKDEQKEVDAFLDESIKAGYSYDDSILTPYREGTKYSDVKFSASDELPLGASIIVGWAKPSIFKDGKLVQSGTPKVLEGTGKAVTYEQSTDTLFISKEKTKVETLKGGMLPLATKEYTVSDIFEGTGKTPVIAVADESGTPSRFQGRELDNPLMEPETSIQGQVYVMIPTSTGKYLPALAYSTPLSQLNQDDWYIQQIVDKISSIPKNIRGIEGASHELYKLLRVPGLSVQIGKQSKGWTSINDLTEATHLRLSYSNPKNPDKPSVTVIPMANGEMSGEDIWKAVSGIIKAYPKITTSVDITKLGNSEEHQRYRNNISRYLHTNLTKGQVHAVNDWFTYEPTAEEKKAKGKQEVDNLRKPEPVDKGKGGKQKSQQTVSLGGRVFNVDGDSVEADDEKLVTEADRQAVLNSLTERGSTQIKSAITIDLSAEDDTKKEENVSLFARGQVEGEESLFSKKPKPSSRFFKGPRGKRLDVTRTTDEAASSKQLENDVSTLKKMFPRLSEEGRIRLVNGLIKTVDESGNPVRAYGMYINGVLYISDQSPKGTAFHEAFHYIIDTLLTQKERDELFEEATNRYGNKDILELEERLSEDFRDYMNGREDFLHSNILTRWFRRLKHIINSIIGNKNAVDVLFYNIYMNRYYKRQENLTKSSTKFSREVYTPEMENIMKDAKENGTFMKAPNGNPTNLTERQWLQVRTKAFKDWFGDWEAIYKADKFNLDAVDYSKVDIEEVDKPWRNDPSKSNKTVRIYLKGQHEKGYFELVKDIEPGQYSVHFKTSKSGAKFNSSEAVESTKEERKTLFKELVKAIPDGAIVSTWGSLSQEGIKGLNNVGRGMTKIGERDATLKTDGSHIKIPIFQKGEGVSKVVDENGEPLVVWHGGSNAKIFDTSGKKRGGAGIKKGIAGTYFTTSKNNAKGYENIYAFKTGEEWIAYTDQLREEGTTEEEIAELDKLWEIEKPATRAFFLNIRIPVETKYTGNSENGYEENTITPNNYDGQHITIEDRSYEEYVATSPNQIKSATDNTGAFSREDNDIRFMRVNESNLESTEEFERELLEYKENKLSYDNLDSETKELLKQRKVSEEDYNNLSTEGKEDTLSCIL